MHDDGFSAAPLSRVLRMTTRLPSSETNAIEEAPFTCGFAASGGSERGCPTDARKPRSADQGHSVIGARGEHDAWTRGRAGHNGGNVIQRELATVYDN